MAMRRAACGRALLRQATDAVGATGIATRGVTTATLPDLPYDFGALEPVVSGQIMELHHSKHHATYVANFNKASETYEEAESKGDFQRMIELQGAIKFNGGGHINHSIFWTNLCPPKDYEPPTGDIKAAIAAEFGSVDKMVAQFNAEAAAVQGSGWGWLGYDKKGQRLVVATTSNQDPLVTKGGALVPLLGIDVWEHAYYLQYTNRRPEYLKEIWKVVNWKNVGERLAAAKE